MENQVEDKCLLIQGLLEKSYKSVLENFNCAYNNQSIVKNHTNVQLNVRPFKCTFKDCNKAYTNRSHLNRHAKVHDKTLNIQKFECKHCLQCFSNASNLKRHNDRTHSNEAKVCEQCNQRFRKEGLYQEHMMLFHELQVDKLNNYECEQCGTKLMSFRSFKKHKKIHLLKSYQCLVINCTSQFYTRKELKEHKKSSHFEQYTCADCDRKFYKKHLLRAHVITHFEERNIFACTYKTCERVYYFKRNLNQHIQLSHMGKKFKCDLCNIKLSTKQKLTQHKMKIHKINR